jgi:hypothetical protein
MIHHVNLDPLPWERRPPATPIPMGPAAAGPAGGACASAAIPTGSRRGFTAGHGTAAGTCAKRG